MNLLDLGIILLLGLITLRGYYRGLFQELGVLAGLVGGVVVAAHAYLLLAVQLKPWIADPTYARGVAFAVIFVAVYWLTRLCAHLLQRLLFHLYLDVLDRLLGGFFAFVKGCLLLGLALMMVGVFVPRHTPLIKESRLVPLLRQVTRQGLSILPPDFKQRLQDYFQEWPKPKKTGGLKAGSDRHD